MRPGTLGEAVRPLVVGAGAVTAAAVVATSLDRNTYFAYRTADRIEWQHPTVAVSLFVLFVGLETIAACYALDQRRSGRLWGRGLRALAFLVPWGLSLAAGAMHSPGFYLLHLLWVWALIGAICLGACVSGAVHAVGRIGPRHVSRNPADGAVQEGQEGS